MDTVQPHSVSAGLTHARQATAAAWRAIESEWGFLTSAEFAGFLGAPASALQLSHDEHQQRSILSVRLQQQWLYPAFQFDTERCCVKPWAARYAELAVEHGISNESALLWLMRHTTYLPHEGRPIDVIDAEPELVLDTARQAWGVQW